MANGVALITMVNDGAMNGLAGGRARRPSHFCRTNATVAHSHHRFAYHFMLHQKPVT